MNNNLNQPREDDAVLGGQAPPPVAGVILGGIEGVKRRLASSVVEVQIAALREALKYGELGLDVVIEALQNNSLQVQRKAYLILRDKTDFKVKQALLDYEPWEFFTTLAGWKHEDFNPQIGITDPVGTAYVVKLDQFEMLLKDPQASKVEALVCRMRYDYQNRQQFKTYVDAISGASKQLTSLKALFIGDGEEHQYRKSRLEVSDISPILKAYPNLEVLQVRGRIDRYSSLNLEDLRHDCLKTLIVETADIDDRNFAQICALRLPALEYLELWLGTQLYLTEAIDSLSPILFNELFPNLSYLGLRSSEETDRIASVLVQSPIIDRLAVLDLSMGTLTDKGAKTLLNCPATAYLHTLNVSNNRLCEYMVEELSELKCWVIADAQDDSGYGGDRYYALNENCEDESDRYYPLGE
ncbi:HEAT repeat domain-containing protein [Microcoleus sp. FACHB-831]|uniref:HEAT repeat domain-containing protein n=1 Tax=Microcoleus sp. FACHB-831 TaxID=2692827 RepID=UPI0016867D17|nr:HEAT repeat domain-containing protein [Microcoleus sp. FACHB-831]MBD1920741.1 HEAT repeat domain-containing protein [Microcoleus sp. FACHB-831]